MPVGAPSKLTDEQKQEVYTAFSDYIVEKDDPTIVGFCAWDEIAIQYNVTKDNMHDWKEFSELRKRAIGKQEAHLLKEGGAGKYNPAIAIFRLKQPQHGYSDRTQVDNTVYLPKPITDVTDVLLNDSNQED